MILENKTNRLTKSKATEIFKKVFGSATGIYKTTNPGQTEWAVRYGETSAVCYINRDNILVVDITFNCCCSNILYFHPETLEAAFDYHEKKQQEEREELINSFLDNRVIK